MTLVMTLCVGLQALGQNAYAVQSGNDAEQGGVNVTHHKDWYDQFTYNWPIGTTAHTSKITDKATDPDQIIALLRYIYMERRLPGIYYAGYGTNSNNVNQRVRPVYYGGIDGGWDIPFNASNNRYTDYETYKPYSEGYTVLLVAVKDIFTMSTRTPDIFINCDYAKLKEVITISVEYVQLLTDGMRLNENLHEHDGYYPGTLFTVDDAPSLNRFFFLSKGQARNQYNADRGDANINAPFGRMFEQFSPTDGTQGSEITNYYEALKSGQSFPILHDCNSVLEAEHYFSMVSKSATGADSHQDVSGLQFFIPDQRLTYFETQGSVARIENTNTHYLQGRNYYLLIPGSWHNVMTFTGGEITSHNVTYDGRIMNYDEGIFIESDDEGVIANNRCINLYITGNELVELLNEEGDYDEYRYTGNGDYEPFNYSNSNPAYTGNAHNGGYTEYAYYHTEFAPKTQWYRIELEADAVQDTQDDFWGEHTYSVSLKWETSADHLSAIPLEQTFWVYEIVDGEEVLISPAEGITQETWTVEDRPGTKENPNGLYTEQYPSGRKRTFVVKGRPSIATYPPIRSNSADAIIPGYDKHERLSLSIGTDYYSKWDAQGQYNQYGNYVLIENGTGNTVTKSLINQNTKFRMWRTWIDEAGHEQTIEFADVVFGHWTGTGTNAKVPYTVTYLNNSQKGSVPEKAPSTSGQFGILNNQDEVDFGHFEVMDVFQASTVNNTHPDHYTYKVTFESAVDFEIDDLDADGNLQFVEDTNGDYYYDPNTQEYHKIVDDAYSGTRYKVKTVTTNAVTSNKEIIPVFKSTYSLNNQGYIQSQIDNVDKANNMSELLTPHMSYTVEGSDVTVTTDLNKVKLNLQADPTGTIHQYSLYRNPQGSDSRMIAWAQAASDGHYSIHQNNSGNEAVEKGITSPMDYNFEDEAIMTQVPVQSVAYVPVISTRPKDIQRLTQGDYNTYGADIQRVGIPKMVLGQVWAEQSTYTWKMNDTDYRYFRVSIPIEASVPGSLYHPYYWRSWRELADYSIIGEEYQELTCNIPGGYLYEQRQPDYTTSITSGEVDLTYPELTGWNGRKNQNIKSQSGTFGAQCGKTIDMDFKIRFYYAVNNVANRAPATDEQVSPNGQFYIVEYNLPYSTSSGIVTGVDGIETDKQVATVTYYNTMGLPSTTAWSGVNIVVTRYTDGTQSTTKVVR